MALKEARRAAGPRRRPGRRQSRPRRSTSATRSRPAPRSASLASSIDIAADVAGADAARPHRRAERRSAVHGILVQLPLPQHIDECRASSSASPSDKDVDGFHLVQRRRPGDRQHRVPACTPYGVQKILEHEGIADRGQATSWWSARSNIVGKPLALMLMQQRCRPWRSATAKTRDLGAVHAARRTSWSWRPVCRI